MPATQKRKLRVRELSLKELGARELCVKEYDVCVCVCGKTVSVCERAAREKKCM